SSPNPPRSGGSLLPAAVSPAGSVGTRGLAGGAAVVPGPGQPGGHAAGAGRGAGAVPGAALCCAVHPRAPAQVGTPARPPPSPPSALSGRKLSGKAGIDEVMAAAVLTSLSASPLVLGHMPATHGPGNCSSSSNTSGDWSWDPSSDRSTPSTPSPPSPPDASLLQNSTKVMFKCLWKSCGKVLSSSSGMQKHIRTVHLGRKADLEQSDGEEDFYYTELDVDVDALTDGLSSLTPVSPTSSVPPAFPGLRLPPRHCRSRPGLCPPVPPPHHHPSHAVPGEPCRRTPPSPLSPACPPVVTCPLYRRRPRGAKKCRKVYGMEHREMWCTACRWKKACQRFLD
uniref:C2H2-type domain-containing protein n=1 Tax=Malurus cyaneus samueli TaxID=2593467 RepID=A0A8C5TZU4_9PASS